MVKIVNLFVVVIVCMIIAIHTVNITTYANEEVGNECVQCGKPADSYGGAITIEHDVKPLIFCCPNCVDKHKKGIHDKLHKDSDHNDHKNNDKQ
ncbi:MAG: hypothetical protein GY775_07330 [Candidatus Scalindua sp.]|nr:hypothetical protein [Candidatus Scalindua sp.]